MGISEELDSAHHRRQLLEKLMDQYGESLTRLAMTYVKDQYIAEDIIQETFLKVYKNLDRFEGRSSYQTYLYRIVMNGCYDYLRSWHHRKVQITEKFTLTHEEGNTSEKHLLDKDKNLELAQNVLKLSIKLREVIILFYYQDFTVDEIAKTLDISQNTVKTRLFRARKKLENQLKEGGWEW
ncbi:sigma-70 family RNA polymerase sigma factor [Tenuibacillus multivorans]|uniref:RNA polymerase sigma factor n=1 Tax=Tenuibacillus multivorans TaxID=237069 RepID=A0A1H0B5F9_9BACI|nr:sigma-70 family RNA polymerase sigma factor [Tenuibacillus multivorans]GEL78638.1 RNA polymerase subunit sigma [Tenuibacillus multivorans]SDN40869.1 RNA polymerase sigma-70 factor, ECF subfamily [Tenuibacillus multivorans]